MRIFAVDPGAVATGVALLEGTHWKAEQWERPQDCWMFIGENLDYHPNEAVLLIEDYRSAGNLTKEAKATLEVVGFFKIASRMAWAFELEDVIVRVEQQRLSGQRDAALLMGDTIDHLKRDPNRKDAFSALSHCVAYRRTLA